MKPMALVTNEANVQTLASLFAQHSNIAAVYLFGSVAEGRATPTSDLDLAIVPKANIGHREYAELVGELADAGFDPVDLVILDTDDVVMRHRAVRLNKVVYSTQAFDRNAYFSQVVREHADFAPYLERQRKAMQRRILNGGPRDYSATN